MNIPSHAEAPPVVGTFPHDVMERAHAEVAITYVGALTGIAGSMIDLLCSAGVENDQAHAAARKALKRSLAEAREVLTLVTSRAFDDIVEEFVRGARVPAADGSCRAAALLERIMRAAR
jgi:hypothetical protein